MKTVILQSQAPSKIRPWIAACMQSVKDWSNHIGADYRFFGDELFNLVPEPIRQKFEHHKIVLTDYARLRLLQRAFQMGYERAIWLDSDAVVFDKEAFVIKNAGYAVGLETWAQKHKGQVVTQQKIHNAFIMATAGNSFLPFYADTALSLLQQSDGNVRHIFIGPELLTKIFAEIVPLSLQRSAGMLSPLAMGDFLKGGGEALEKTLEYQTTPMHCVNLAASLVQQDGEEEGLPESDYERAVELLLSNGLPSIEAIRAA